MKFLTLKNITIENTKIPNLSVYLDDEGNIIFLPLLWLIHLSSKLKVWKWSQTGYFNKGGRRSSKKAKDVEAGFKEEEILQNTAKAYAHNVFDFLKYLNQDKKSGGAYSAHDTHLIDSKKVNNYLNKVLPLHAKSSSTLEVHCAALKAFFGFLYCAHFGIKDELEFSIDRQTIQFMADKDDRPKKTKYISRSARSTLLQNCNCERDRLIIRLGFEAGLRASENMGLVLSHHRAKGQKNEGLLTLFEDLDKSPNKNRFKFLLNGRFTKRGRSRYVYFDRELLVSMKRYYQTERKKIVQETGKDAPTLFLRTDVSGKGLPINERHASNLFKKLKKFCPYMNSEQSYHDLRHSFATELYYSELLDKDGKETRSREGALLTVQLQLGHKSEKSTLIYIRLCKEMKIIEGLAS